MTKKRNGKYDVSLFLALLLSAAIVGFAVANASALECPEGMVSYWRFDEGDGTTAADSYDANPGTLNDPAWTTGQIGGALSFGGYVKVPNAENLNPSHITIEAWVNPTSYGYYRSIVGKKYYDDSTWQHPWDVYLLRLWEQTAQPSFRVAVDYDHKYEAVSSQTIPMDTWTHLAGTYDGETVKIYINGELAGSVTSSPIGGIEYRPDGPLYIGAIAGTNNNYTGRIDEVAIYNKALTLEEIQQHYQNGLNGNGYCTDSDSDSDGMPDEWETTDFGDLSHDGSVDTDSDGLTDLQEYENNTDPNDSDSDDDGMSDGWEVDNDLDPTTDDANSDADNDRFTNGREYQDQTDPSSSSSHLSLTVSSGRIPDTGQTKCYDNSTEITCPQSDESFHGQDANYTMNPASYLKMDSQGNYVPDSAASWAMVRDNTTGLIWEVKTDDGTIHDKDKTYTWCDTNPDTNGGDSGTCGNGTDTEDFINALNAADYGGFSDWHLPTREELRSIVNYDRLNLAIDTAFFPKTISSDYWSSSTHADNTSNAWRVYFGSSYGSSYNKSNSYYVRAVRRGQSGSLGHLIINGDGTVTDTDTGLIWQQATATNSMNWQNALSYCENLTLGGYDDWRLPNIKELASLGDLNRYNPAIDTDYFSDTVSSDYWSSTANAINTYNAWRVYFNRGDVSTNNKTDSYHVRAVRGGQSRLLDHLAISSPNQASSWNVGQTMPIAWETQEIAGNVKISLSRDGGKTYETIAESTENDGSRDWAVTGPESVNCMLKIEPIDNPSKGTRIGLLTINSNENIINVPSDYQSIQTAIDVAFDGDIILVSPGTYNENIDFNGKSIVLSSLYYSTGDRSYISQTIIDGNKNGSVVTFADGETNATHIIGFTIQNGKSDKGGGVYVNNSSHPVIDHCIIIDNIATFAGGGRGGGIYSNLSSPAITSCIITNNIAYGGAGIFISNPSTAQIKSNIIINNSTPGSGLGGGGIYCDYTTGVVIENNVIANNDGGQKAGGIALSSASTVIVNNTIVNNSADFGSAIYAWHDASPTVLNTIVWGNTGDDVIYLDYSNFSENTSITVNYSNIQGGYEGEGNLNADPLFIADSNYRISEISPCIDTGTFSDAPSTDIDGIFRPQGYGYDPHSTPVWDDLRHLIVSCLRDDTWFLAET